MKNAVAVIDFGSSEVVTLVGGKGVNNTLNIFGKGKIHYAGFQNSEFLEPEKLAEVVKNSISKAESMFFGKITEIYIGVPGEFSAVVPKTVSLTFPKAKKITQFDVDNIFKTGNTFEKESDYCLINKSVVYYELDDYQRVISPIDMKSKTIVGNVSYTLAMASFVSQIKTIFSKLRITVKGFISSVFAECMYLFEPSIRDRYVLFADVGYITTTVALAQGNGLLYQNSFSMGGGYISSDLAQCLRIPFAEAESLKEKVAIAWQPTQQDNYVISTDENMLTYSAKATNEIALDRIELICDYIQRCLDACEYELPSFLPIYLTGGGFHSIKGIKNLISQKLKRQVLTISLANYHEVKPYNASVEGLLSFVLNNTDILENLIIKV